MRVVVLLAIPAMVLGRAAPGGSQPCAEADRPPLTEMGVRFGVDRPLGSSPSVADDGARYMRVRVRVTGGEAGKWFLTVRDEKFRPVQVLTSEDFPGGATEKWTVRVPGREARLDLDSPGTPPAVTVLEYLAMPSSATRPFYSLLNPALGERFSPLYESAALGQRKLGDFVGFLMGSWSNQTWCCSGVALAPDLFLTNWHCGGVPAIAERDYWNPVFCSETLIDFSWDGDVASREYHCSEVLAVDRKLDFALLRIKPIHGVGQLRPAVIGKAPSARSGVEIVHHPACRIKQVSFGCTVIADRLASDPAGIADARFGHDCDTEGGSSGAPVFNRSGEVVGLHHHGFDWDSATCKPKDRVNKAVRMDAVLAEIRRQRPELAGLLRVAP